MCVCLYVFQEKTIYIVALLHNNWIVRHCYVFLLTQQLKETFLWNATDLPSCCNSLGTATQTEEKNPKPEKFCRGGPKYG
jgi:hypothetical protein